MHLADIARAGPRFSRQETDKISAEAHTRIGGWVLGLNDWRLANLAPSAILRPGAKPFAATPAAKAGRNEPRPCGSGRKYKKCYGLN